MKAIDLQETLKLYTKGWVAIDKKTKKVVAHAATFAAVSQKVEGKSDVFLMPVSKQYFGFVTSVNA